MYNNKIILKIKKINGYLLGGFFLGGGAAIRRKGTREREGGSEKEGVKAKLF